MIDSLVASIGAAFSHPSALAFGAATLWGLLSVLLSPCHLGAIPLIVAYINNGERPDRRRAFGYSFLFAVGLLVMLAVIGAVTSLAGRLLGDVGSTARIIVAGSAEVAYGASLMAFYAIGHTTAIVVAGGLGDLVGAMLRER